MSGDLALKSSCDRCGAKSNLYGSSCKHMTICLACGKTMAETKAACSECGVCVTRLIREYNVRASNISNKTYSIGTFKHGLPDLFNKKGSNAKCFMHKEGLKGPQLTDAVRDKYKNRPWIIEDETGNEQYQGQHEDSQGTYYILVIHGKEFLAIPVDAWYHFSKVAKYKQLSLEEAEEKMKNRRRISQGFSRWMTKIANSGAAEECAVEKLEGRRRRKKAEEEADDSVLSDKGEEDEDEDEEEARKCRLGLNKRGGDDDAGEVRRGDLDADDDDIEKGDDWEHEEVFADDDEAIGSAPEDEVESDSEDLDPPEIKQDEYESDEGGKGLSTSGKELMKLLERQSGLDDDNGDKDINQENHSLPVLSPREKPIPKEPIKATATIAKTSAANPITAVTTKYAKRKRKSGNEDVQPSEAEPTKRQKTEDSKSTETATSRNQATSGKYAVSASNNATVTQATGAVTEEELLNFLRQMAPITTRHLSDIFKSRLKTQEDKIAFANILKKISHLEKRNGANYLVLRNI